MISLTKLEKGVAGWVCSITIITTATESQSCRFNLPQQVEQTTMVYLLEALCNRWQMIRLCCNLIVFILIRDKHLPDSIIHRGSVLMWFWGHIKPVYCTLDTSTHSHHTHTKCAPYSLWSFLSDSWQRATWWVRVGFSKAWIRGGSLLTFVPLCGLSNPENCFI